MFRIISSREYTLILRQHFVQSLRSFHPLFHDFFYEDTEVNLLLVTMKAQALAYLNYENAMFKPFFLKALMLIALSLLLINMTAERAIAQPLLQINAEPLTGSIAQQDIIPATPRPELAPAIEPANNRPSGQKDKSVDPRSIKPQQRQAQPSTTPIRTNRNRPQDPYEDYYDAIQQFNQEVYGEEG
ncbi:MAG: hypothetical protein WBB01_16710 [Phormidesmis sp.]